MAVNLDVFHPFDAGAGSSVTELQWRNMARYWLSTGIIRGALNQHEVFADATGMQVKVRTGHCWIQGHYGEQTAERTLAIATAHASLARKDRVIIRADFVNNRIELDVKTGTAAASPVEPSLTQSTSVWEISLAIVNVPAANTNIAASQVVNDRTQYTSNTNSPGSLITETVLTVATASVTFSSIPQHFRHLQLISRASTTAAAGTALMARFNGDATGPYDLQYMEAGGTVVASGRVTALTAIDVSRLSPTDPNIAASGDCLIVDYSSSAHHKMVVVKNGFFQASAGGIHFWAAAGIWFGPSSAGKAAITSITLFAGTGNLAAGTKLSLHGLN